MPKITSRHLTITAGTLLTISAIIFGAGKFVGTTNEALIRVEDKIDVVATDVKSIKENINILVIDHIKEDGTFVSKKDNEEKGEL